MADSILPETTIKQLAKVLEDINDSEESLTQISAWIRRSRFSKVVEYEDLEGMSLELFNIKKELEKFISSYGFRPEDF